MADAYHHIRCWIRVYIHTAKLTAMDIRTRADAEKAVEHARAIYRNIKAKADWDARVLDKARYPSDEYYKFYVASHYARPSAMVETVPQAEDAIGDAFERISRAPIGDTGAFWQRVIAQDGDAGELSLLAKAQLRLLQRGDRAWAVVLADDFESVEERRDPVDRQLLETYRWSRRKELPVGYGVWSYLGRPADFVWTDRLAHSGKRCIGIESNEVKACVLRHLPVEPGERYRVSVAATRVWQEGTDGREISPHLTVAWQGERGWAAAPRMTKSIPVDAAGIWHKSVVRVTVPPDATRMVVMLGVSGSQLGVGGTYFDDLRVSRMGGEGVDAVLD